MEGQEEEEKKNREKKDEEKSAVKFPDLEMENSHNEANGWINLLSWWGLTCPDNSLVSHFFKVEEQFKNSTYSLWF